MASEDTPARGSVRDERSRRGRRRHVDEPGKPTRLREITAASWRHAGLRVWRGFWDHQCIDLAAGLTFFSITSVLPLVIALVAVLGVVGRADETVTAIMEVAAVALPAEFLEYIEVPVRQIVQSPFAGVFLGVALVASLFTASAWVNAFSRAINRIYGATELRPLYLLRPLMMAITLAEVLLLALFGLVLVGTVPLISRLGASVGLREESLWLWGVARGPLLLLIAAAVVALLYFFTPNVRQPPFRWTSPGALLAIGLSALAIRGLFAYLAAFGTDTFNRTYGALATPLVLVLSMYLVNLSLILGIEVNAGIERARQLQSGIDAVGRIQLPHVSEYALPRLAALRAADAAKARALLTDGSRTGAVVRASGGSTGDTAAPGSA